VTVFAICFLFSGCRAPRLCFSELSVAEVGEGRNPAEDEYVKVVDRVTVNFADRQEQSEVKSDGTVTLSFKPSIRYILSGKIKWKRRVGWCDQPFVSINLHPVVHPTEDQIRYVQSIRTYADQSFLQIRQLLQQGDKIAFGMLLPEDAEQSGVSLRELGFTYSTVKRSVYRPR
jgi:hypothetical protein